MARIPFAERSGSRRALGVLLLALLAFFVWLTWAIFSKAFVNYDNVTLTGVKAGLNLPENADIKLRGMIVGEVREVKVVGDEINFTLGMNPDLIDNVPADVTAQIVPKTLFGEKYVSLIPPDEISAAGPKLKAGDTIRGAIVPIEFEKVLNDFYPLLTAVEPKDLATTLSAMATTFEGRGEDFGNTLVTMNNYLEKFNPESQGAVDDIIKLGQLSDSYARDMPTFGRLLRNSAFSSRTVVAKRTELAAFFDESRRLSDELTVLFRASGGDMVAVAAQSVVPLGVAEKYSSTFPCLFKAYDRLIDERLDSVFRGLTLHIDLEMVSPQPTAYHPGEEPEWRGRPSPPGEHPVIPKQSVIDAEPATDPDEHGVRSDGGPEGLGTVCDDLYKFAAGENPWSQENPWPGPDPGVFKMIGVLNSHNGKLGTDADYNRAAVASLAATGYFEPSLRGVDSPSQRTELNRMAAVTSGVPVADVPDVASLLLSPVVRGAGVNAR